MVKHEILYPDTDYANLILKWSDKQLDIYSVDSSGDVEISFDNGYGDYSTMYLDQEGIKMLIDHLQKQLK